MGGFPYRAVILPNNNLNIFDDEFNSIYCLTLIDLIACLNSLDRQTSERRSFFQFVVCSLLTAHCTALFSPLTAQCSFLRDAVDVRKAPQLYSAIVPASSEAFCEPRTQGKLPAAGYTCYEAPSSSGQHTPCWGVAIV